MTIKLERNKVYLRDSYCCKICDTAYTGDWFSRLEAHHILSSAQAKRLHLTKQQLDDARNLITLCRKCHSLTYSKRRKYKDPQLFQKLNKLQDAKERIHFYGWFEEIKVSISPDKRPLLLAPEAYGPYFKGPKSKYYPK